jgi:hypothetical protein
MGNGVEVKLKITIGFTDRTMATPVQVFCADFKAGSDFHAIIMDGCILISRLLQFGDRPEDIKRSLAHPLLITLVQAVEKIHEN